LRGRAGLMFGCLIDLSLCIGCRSCQAACKQAHRGAAERTRWSSMASGYQNPPLLSAKTRTLISFHELPQPTGEVQWVFVKRQCLHCTDARCASACPPQAYYRTDDGVVVCDSSKCVACGVCLDECPWGVPSLEYRDLNTPRIVKCDWCIDRRESDHESFRGSACAQACPTGAIRFGQRPELLAYAHRRLAEFPARYQPRVYGEKELDGTGWLYISHVPFEKVGLPAEFPAAAGGRVLGRNNVPRGLTALAVCAAAAVRFAERREEVALVEGRATPPESST